MPAPRPPVTSRHLASALLAAVLAVTGASSLPACATTSASSTSTPVRPAATAASLPPMQHTLTSGATWSSTATVGAGKLLVLDVWASWCKPCKKGLPRLDRIAAAQPDVVVLGLSLDEDEAAMRAFLAEVPVSFPSARVPAATVQAAPLSIQSLPAVIVVDRQGRIRWIAEDMKDVDYDAIPRVLDQLRAE